ncbi:MAG: hypothetical protein CVT49_02405 [candidate division Zixibacteria bacterium HGW-Zixibacteria-1]|nr:MAG: hypothetical protein CVT49_02405 [candidate division Zixibacteria bacterium HGW-Zixibacteria-1]
MKRSFILLLVLSVAASFAVGNAYECGDLNNDGSINVLDIVYLINYLYKGGPAPAFPYLADVNGSHTINILDVTALIGYLYRGGPAPACSTVVVDPIIVVEGHSGCKSPTPEKAELLTPPDQDCIQYSYEGTTGILSLVHVNAGFNCCPEQFLADITFGNDTITITENESYGEWGACLCLCLFDVSYSIINLPPGQYTIKVIGLELYGDDEYLEFTADLGAAPVGEYCLTRNHYPWGEMLSPVGTIIGEPVCKNYQLKIDTTYEDDCIIYDYDGAGTLDLTHVNDMFNCCPESLYIVVTLTDNVIRLNEYETEGLCDCICLFDMDYQIINLLPAVYTLIVDNVNYYNEYSGGPIEFEIDLTAPTSGVFCVDRPYLPWVK